MEDLSLLYIKLCDSYNSKPSNEIKKLLKGKAAGRLLRLDLSKVYISKKSIPVLSDMISLCSSMTALDVSRGQLDNDDLIVLVDAMKTHPSLNYLNLSFNELSLPAGKVVLDLVKNNTNLIKVDLENTLISDNYKNRIALQLELNSSRESQKKDLCFGPHEGGDIDLGIGVAGHIVRNRLHLGSACGDADEHYDCNSDIGDNIRLKDRETTTENIKKEEKLQLSQSGMPGIAEDYLIENPNMSVSLPAGQINVRLAQPQYMIDITKEMFNKNEKWTDSVFPPSAASIVTQGTLSDRSRRCSSIGWIRASCAPGCDSPSLFIDQTKPSLPILGHFADHWLCNTLLVLSRYPKYLTKLFTKVCIVTESS